jgi:hypothetical protein
MDFVQGLAKNLPRNDCAIVESGPPKLSSVTFRDAELVATEGEDVAREVRFQLVQHVAENEAQLDEVTAVVGVLVEHLLLAILEEFDRLFALANQVLHEKLEVLVLVESLQTIFVLPVDLAQMLVRIRKDVQDERR